MNKRKHCKPCMMSLKNVNARDAYLYWMRCGFSHVHCNYTGASNFENRRQKRNAKKDIENLEMEIATREPTAIHPPKTAEFLLYLILPRETRNEICGDVSQQYFFIVSKFGLRKAKVFFYKETLFTVIHEISKLVPGRQVLLWITESFQRLIC